jgi:hypothetical protein
VRGSIVCETADAVDLVVVAVVAGGGEGLIGADGEDGDVVDDAAAAVGALDAEPPGAAVRREAAGEDLAADVDEGAGGRASLRRAAMRSAAWPGAIAESSRVRPGWSF